MESEYGVKYLHSALPFQFIQRIANEEINIAALNLASDTKVVRDVFGRYYLLFTGQWSIKWATDNNPALVPEDFDRI